MAVFMIITARHVSIYGPMFQFLLPQNPTSKFSAINITYINEVVKFEHKTIKRYITRNEKLPCVNLVVND